MKEGGCEWNNNWQATRLEPKYQIQACYSECEVYREVLSEFSVPF